MFSIYNLVIVTIVNIAASLFIVKIPSVATIATIITNIITITITTMIFLVIQVGLIFSRVIWHTCKKREIPEIYLRKFFWIFRKILG